MKSKIFCIAFVFLLTGCKNEVAVTPHQIILSGLTFSPDTMTVPIGTTVSWLNIESVTHTVTSDAGDSIVFNSGNMFKGNEFNFTFTKAGTFPYHCNYHSGMTGKIIVPSGTNPNLFQVNITGFAFDPLFLTIPVGASVTWKNNDAATHTVTSSTSIFDSGDLTQGKSYTQKFTIAGTYPYICIYHSNMKATIVVQ